MKSCKTILIPSISSEFSSGIVKLIPVLIPLPYRWYTDFYTAHFLTLAHIIKNYVRTTMKNRNRKLETLCFQGVIAILFEKIGGDND